MRKINYKILDDIKNDNVVPVTLRFENTPFGSVDVAVTHTIFAEIQKPGFDKFCRNNKIIRNFEEEGETKKFKDISIFNAYLDDYNLTNLNISIVPGAVLGSVRTIKSDGFEDINVSAIDTVLDFIDEAKENGFFDEDDDCIYLGSAVGMPVSLVSALNDNPGKTLGAILGIKNKD